MKYYRHTMTLREELLHQRRRERIQAGTDLLVILTVPVFIFIITVWALS
jgi:hypothetical protein